jgi:formate hydrogenlyase subunit 6/NADH:ubiquinone oxidoreductase subunit I
LDNNGFFLVILWAFLLDIFYPENPLSNHFNSSYQKRKNMIMKTEIYFFSGSGNSLAIAKNLSKKLGNSQPISIPQVIDKKNDITGDIIGIVCPIYFNNMPHIVNDFIKKIKEARYIFMVYAGNGVLGSGNKTTKKLFGAQNIKLSALFNITMPDNSTKYGEISEEDRKLMFDNADKKIEEIVRIVIEKEEYFDSNNTSHFKSYVHPGLLHKLLYRGMKKMDKDFRTDENCIGCGTCQKVCPVNNIKMIDNKPVWNKNGRCQVCCACHDWCPKESIQHSSTTAGVKRYHNPTIPVKDIIRSSVEK